LEKTIAFVPTMGALHEGHLSLIDLANAHADIVVCSVFVNPTQFNESSDLKSYPRVLDQDMRLLIDRGCDVLFVPGVNQVYPGNLDTSVTIDLGGLDELMEGAHRPGHFKGMLQVVNRLLQIIHPEYLIMGQKDYQQYKIVERMIELHSLPYQLIMAPISRESDGLARSSRNSRLTHDFRSKSIVLNSTLNWVQSSVHKLPIGEIESIALNKIRDAGLEPEYVSLVNANTLRPVTNEDQPMVVCAAAWAGDVRLIDNVVIH
jgi:pantoate--beta-alanine ligase